MQAKSRSYNGRLIGNHINENDWTRSEYLKTVSLGIITNAHPLRRRVETHRRLCEFGFMQNVDSRTSLTTLHYRSAVVCRSGWAQILGGMASELELIDWLIEQGLMSH